MIRVLLVEDQTMVREALAALLDLEDDIDVVGQASDGEAAIRIADSCRPDVAVVDIELPKLDGLAVTAQLSTRLSSCRVLIVTTFDRPGYLRRAMDAGASGFMLKDAPAADLAAAIRAVSRGERVVDQALALAALAGGSNPLTDRERQVLAAARHHATVALVASFLHLSEGTVRNHLSSVIGKLGARNRIDAIRIAERRGWL